MKNKLLQNLFGWGFLLLFASPALADEKGTPGQASVAGVALNALPANRQVNGATNSLTGPNGRRSHLERRRKWFEEFVKDHSDTSGKPRPDLWRKAIEDTRKMQMTTGLGPALNSSKPTAQPKIPTSGGTTAQPKTVIGTQWMQIGPASLWPTAYKSDSGTGPVSGEVVGIAIDPRGTSDQVIYLVCDDGGVWRSTDGGNTWQPLTDSMPSLSMGAIALDSANPSIVYAGTGNNYDPGFIFSKGVGIYRSTDMGANWVQPAGNSLLVGLNITRIVVPAANTLLVGTTGGLFKSVDGGDHYGNNPPTFDNGQKINSTSLIIDDIDIDTQAAGTIYACVEGQGVFKSTDYGTSFTSQIFTTSSSGQSDIGYLSFAQSRSPNNQTMYLNVQVDLEQIDPATGDGPARIYKSVNGGGSWFELVNGSVLVTNTQVNFDQTIGVDPLDANRVYMGFVPLYESTNGGTSWTNISTGKVHDDNHALVFSPHLPGSPPTRVYAGNDGGISYYERDGGSCSNINNGIASCLVYNIDIGRGSDYNRGFTFAGMQDNGTGQHSPANTGTDWQMGLGGDGGGAVVDPTNPQIAYGTADFDTGPNSFEYTTDGGTTWSSAKSGLPNGNGNPLAVDPNNHLTVYVIGPSDNNLYRSTDGGNTFASIHPFSSGVSQVAVAPSDSNTIWVRLGDNTLWRTTNALSGASSTWTSVPAPNPTGTNSQPMTLRGIAVDPVNSSEVFIIYKTYSGIGPTNRTKHVFYTTNNGSTWTDISGTDGGDPTLNLPDAPLYHVVIDPTASPHSIVVSSDSSVMISRDLGATWGVLGPGLPSVLCLSLALDYTAPFPLLRVGTYGRSVFEYGFGPLGYVWVDFNYTNSPQVGTYANPYSTLAQGTNAVNSGGTILIKPGTSSERMTISKPMSIYSVNGSATIGQ